MKTGKMSRMKELLSEAEDAKAIATIDGKDVMDFQSIQKVNRAELAIGEDEDLGDRNVNPDGLTYASSKVKRTAIDPDVYFANRYKRIVETEEIPGKKELDPPTVLEKIKYQVVTDYRAIQEQASGALYKANIVAYVVEKNTKGQLEITGQELVSEFDFVNNFGRKLKNEDMKKIASAIKQTGDTAEADSFEF